MAKSSKKAGKKKKTKIDPTAPILKLRSPFTTHLPRLIDASADRFGVIVDGASIRGLSNDRSGLHSGAFKGLYRLALSSDAGNVAQAQFLTCDAGHPT